MVDAERLAWSERERAGQPVRIRTWNAKGLGELCVAYPHLETPMLSQTIYIKRSKGQRPISSSGLAHTIYKRGNIARAQAA